MTKTGRNQQGFSTLEIMIALVIIVLSISAVMLMVFGSQSTSLGTQTNQEALYKAQQVLEAARAQANLDFFSVSSTAPVGDDIYTKQLNVTDSADGFTKTVTSLVSWAGKNVSLSTALTDWTAMLTGDTCSPTLVGDWTNPQLLGTADVGQNNGGTDVQVWNKKAYITADASDASKGDFYVVDVSDPTKSNLPILGSVNTGPGLAAVAVEGNQYAFVANISTVSQLQVIDISNSSSPKLVTSLKVTPAGDTAVGNSIYYSKGRVYLGTTKSSGAEFYVIDVSNPNSLSASSIKASFEINSAVNAIVVRNGIAYLAAPDDPSTPAIAEQLKELNVADADNGNISLLASYGPNPSTLSGEGLYLSKDSKTLYLGEGGANPGNNPQFFALNISTPGTITKISSKYIPTSKSVGVNALAVRSNLAFLWTSDTNLGFQIWDLNNLGSNIPYAALNTQQTATGGFDCDGNFIYTAQQSQKALQIIGPGVIPFAYSLSNIPDMTLNSGGSPVALTITVTMTSGTPQPVTLTAPNPASSDITISPGSVLSCTPSATAPNTCTVTFNYSALSGAKTKTYNNQIISGSPNGMSSNNFKITVQ